MCYFLGQTRISVNCHLCGEMPFTWYTQTHTDTRPSCGTVFQTKKPACLGWFPGAIANQSFFHPRGFQVRRGYMVAVEIVPSL